MDKKRFSATLALLAIITLALTFIYRTLAGTSEPESNTENLTNSSAQSSVDDDATSSQVTDEASGQTSSGIANADAPSSLEDRSSVEGDAKDQAEKAGGQGQEVENEKDLPPNWAICAIGFSCSKKYASGTCQQVFSAACSTGLTFQCRGACGTTSCSGQCCGCVPSSTIGDE